jgi:hypothetical protein
MEVTAEWESAEDFTRFIKEIAPPVTAMLGPHPAEVQEETWAAIAETVGRHAEDDGRLRLSNLALVAGRQRLRARSERQLVSAAALPPLDQPVEAS